MQLKTEHLKILAVYSTLRCRLEEMEEKYKSSFSSGQNSYLIEKTIAHVFHALAKSTGAVTHSVGFIYNLRTISRAFS